MPRGIIVEHKANRTLEQIERPWLVTGAGPQARWKTRDLAIAFAIREARRRGTKKHPVELRVKRLRDGKFDQQFARTYPRCADPKGTRG